MLKKWAALLLALQLCLLAACSQPDSGASSQAGTPAPAEQNTDTLSQAQKEQLALLALHCADTIPDVFSSPEEIPAYDLTRFLYTRMKADGVAAEFERSGDSLSVYVPIDKVREYAQTYFGITEIKVDFITQQYFNGQEITIPNPDEGQKELPYLIDALEDEITINGDRVTVPLLYSSGEVNYQRRVYTLRVDREGAAVFVSSQQMPVEFGLYAINGAAAEFTELVGVPVSARTVKQFQFAPFGADMLVYIPSGDSMRIGILDLETNKSDKYITVDAQSPSDVTPEVQVIGQQIFLYYQDRVLTFDQDLLAGPTINYPKALLADCDSTTKRLVLSPDQKIIAFSNAEGFQYFSLARGSSQLVLAHPEPSGQPLQSRPVWQPIGPFDEQSGHIIVAATRRNGVNSFAVCDRKSSYRMVQIAGDESMLYSQQNERLLAFNPSSVRREPVLPGLFAEYHTLTGTLITVPAAAMQSLTAQEINGGAILLTQDMLYHTERMPVGEDIVDSCTIRTVSVPGGKNGSLSFGYVDRASQLILRARSENGRIMAVCSGAFINRLVLI